MGSCDFSKGNWSCVSDNAGRPSPLDRRRAGFSCEDPELKSFSIERYRASMLPMIRRAQAVGATGVAK